MDLTRILLMVYVMRQSNIITSCLNWVLLLRYFKRSNGYVGPQGRTLRPTFAVGMSQQSHFSLPSLLSVSMIDSRDSPPPDFTVLDEDEGSDAAAVENHLSSLDIHDLSINESGGKTTSANDESIPAKRKAKAKATSWMSKNSLYVDTDQKVRADYNIKRSLTTAKEDADRPIRSRPNEAPTKDSGRNVRKDFRGSRVFVQGIPSETSWQDLKDHFRVAGDTVFASISIDPTTGESKGCGIVQFETTEMAQNAIKVMRNHPMGDSVLYVREDFQEMNQRSTPMRVREWRCADAENMMMLSDDDTQRVMTLIQARDDARRRRNYETSDALREQLKHEYAIHLDDKNKLFWLSLDGATVPEKIKSIKGDGAWDKRPKEWRMIPTTPENDACVNPDLVNGLLMQRDIARREKDFATADRLLEEARTAPDGELNLRIHDESRTWRIWTTEKPPKEMYQRPDLARECIELIRKHAPHKESEIRKLLEKNRGREIKILNRLKESLEETGQ